MFETCDMCHFFQRGVYLLQSSLFGEGGHVYSMGAGGPRPGMLRISIMVTVHVFLCWESCLRLTKHAEADLDFGGAGGFQQSGGHPALGMNSYGQVEGDEC